MKKCVAWILSVMFCVAWLSFCVSGQDAYDETDASAVTVKLTISADGMALLGNDTEQTVLASLPITVPYFDLDLYGLSDFYRYHANEKGQYVGNQVIERPTLLHLYIYLLEKFYMGLQDRDCCKGTSGVLQCASALPVYNRYGDIAYDTAGKRALLPSGTPGCMYLSEFWGHDENLMYLRNHKYPIKTGNLGATCDYILLSDGDCLDIAMFTNWKAFTKGAFLHLDKDVYSATVGEPVSFKAYAVATGGLSESATQTETTATVHVLDANWNPVGATDKGTFTFSEPGKYYLEVCDDQAATENAVSAPGYAMVQVTKKVQFSLVSTAGTAIKVSWWKPYSSAKLRLQLQTQNVEYDKVVYSSDNKKVQVNDKGEVTNKGLFQRKATITATAYSENTVVAEDAVELLFYKFPWQAKGIKALASLLYSI